MSRKDFDQELSHEIWLTNYQGPSDKTVVDTRNRQAIAAAAIENKKIRSTVETDFKWLLEDGKGSGGGRITANLGVDGRSGTTLMNCFVNEAEPQGNVGVDSMEGIYKHLTKSALTWKSEGGFGMNCCIRFDQIINIKRNDNITQVKIEDVTPGDLVKTDDGSWNEVEEILVREKYKMVKLELDNGEVLEMSDDHPVYIKTKNNGLQWIEAKDLTEDMEVVSVK